MSRENPLTSHDNAGIASWNFKLKGEIHSYSDCKEFLKAVRPAHDAELGPHMKVVEYQEFCAVVLYDTEIIRYYQDGTFSVDNGGFNTPTTMYRLSAVLPEGWSVYHHKKKLKLVNYDDPTAIRTIYPATHERKVMV